MLLDQGFASDAYLATVTDTGAAFLTRLSVIRKSLVLRRFDDGLFLSRVGSLDVRIIELATSGIDSIVPVTSRSA